MNLLPRGRKSRPILIRGLLAVVVIAPLLAADIFPIITNDSKAYISHSNAITATGFIQFGYRQFGYPAFLALVDFLSSTFHYEPLLSTALLQRVIYLSGLGFVAWIWRWRAAPLIAFALLPTLVIYTNLILTEGLGVGLAIWYGALVGWLVQQQVSLHGTAPDRPTERVMIAAGAGAAALWLALLTIRFHYILLSLGAIAALYAMYRSGHRVRRAAGIIGIVAVVAGASFLLLTSRENANEYGPFFPTVRGERARFWAAWQVTFTLHPENRDIPELADLYADGDPNAVVRDIDARYPEYRLQTEALDEALDELIRDADTSYMKERLQAFAGALRGGRIDDVRPIVLNASVTSYATVEQSIFRTSLDPEHGIPYILSTYNEGRLIQPVLTSPLAPVRSYPYFVSVYRWLWPIVELLLIGGLVIRSSRLLALVALLTILGTAVVFGYLLMDDVRFLLVPLLFSLTVTTGAIDSMWRWNRGRGGRSDRGNPSARPSPRQPAEIR